MNIVEAVKAAEEKGWVAIGRAEYILAGLMIIPSDNEGGFWLYVPEEELNKLSHSWLPKKDDILAEDWYPIGLTRERFYRFIESGALKVEDIRLLWNPTTNK